MKQVITANAVVNNSPNQKTIDRNVRRRDELGFATDVLVAILSDGFNTLPYYRIADYRRDVLEVKTRIAGEGLYFLTEVLPRLASDMFEQLEGRPAVYNGFKTIGGVPLFCRDALLRAIGGQTEYISFIYQVSVAFKKIEGQYSKKALKSQYEEFVSVDSSLDLVDWFSDQNLPILERARHLAKRFAEDFDPFSDLVVPRPGPGATNTPSRHYTRFAPSVVYERADAVYPFDLWFYHNPWAVNSDTRAYLGLPRVKEATSRFKFVPKTARKARGICIEENEIQFLQQGLRRALTKHISKHPLYSKRITLNDQSVNQWMALESSKTRSFATIDMSSASDRVSRELVSWLFQDTELHDPLMALSTRQIIPPKELKKYFGVLRTKKYAPMGSALCFPVMSLVFMFLIRATIQLSSEKYPHHLSTNVFVYGDDIVIPSSVYTIVCDSLTRFGLKVNNEKSFVKSHFRESCGVHAYKGVNITPCYIRKHPHAGNLTSMVSLIETEFQFHEKGYHMTSNVLRAHGLIRYGFRLKGQNFVPHTSTVVGWKRRVPPSFTSPVKAFKVKWHRDTQQYLYKVVCTHTKQTTVGLIHEPSAILRWICLAPEPFSSHVVPDEVSEQISLRDKWVPRSAIYC